MNPVLWRVFAASLLRHRLTTALSWLAVALGVALALAVQVIHDAALDELGRGVRSLAGAADLQLVGPRDGFSETLLDEILALREVAEASPVVEVEARRLDGTGSLRVLGLDPFRAVALQPGLLPRPTRGADRLTTLAEDALFPTPTASRALGLTPWATIRLQAGGAAVEWRVAGTAGDDLTARGEEAADLAVADIAAVQWRFGWLGRLSRIDLRLAPGANEAKVRARLQPILPAGVDLQRPEVEESQAAALSRAYRVNLTLLAAIALLTGGFLVFSTQALAVVRRRMELAFLRAIGMDRAALARGLLLEGGLVGLLGGITGVALGYAVAGVVLRILGGDLGAGYFRGVAPPLAFEPALALGYGLLGVLAGLAGAAAPAREALTVAPAQALKAGDETRVFAFRPRVAVALACFAAALACALLPPVAGIPLGGYGAVAGVLAGALALLPGLTRVLPRLLPRRALPLKLAAGRLAGAPGQAVVAAAGVLASVALASAMAIMVSSFRGSVVEWLDQVLPADLYLRSSSATSGWLDESAQADIAAQPGVVRALFTRQDSIRLIPGQAPLALVARPVAAGVKPPLVARGIPPDALPPVWISEAARDRLGLAPGDRLELPVGGRAVPFGVAGVWRDYARQQGAVLVELDDWRRLGGDPRVHDAALFLQPDANPDKVAAALQGRLGQGAEIVRPAELRAISLAIFDRTFAVTYVLEAVAVVIGLFGIATSYAALATARRREFGMLRHLGVSRRQVAAMLALEGGLTAAAGVAGGLAAGGAIGLVLVRVVNPQSFHWSMDMHLPWVGLAVFATVLVALSALSAVLAGRSAMGQGAVVAVREDW
jgi:putative ABC transport system permease protein